MAKKKLYFTLSDGEDVSNVVMKLSGCMQWIENDNEMEMNEPKEYILTPVWMTDKEYRNLPEAEI